MQNKILFFSDCHIYGGSERSIVNLMNWLADRKEYEIHFSYRKFKEYQHGLDRDLSANVNAIPLQLFTNGTLFHKINKTSLPGLIKKIFKIPFWLLGKSGIYSLVNYFVLLFAFRKVQPDIIHVNNGGYPASPVCQAAIFAANKVCSNIIYHINNPAQPRNGFLKRTIDKKINKIVKFFITASLQALKSLEEVCLFEKTKLVQIYNTIEPPQLTNTRTELLNNYGIPENKFILAEVAFLSERKGQMHILNALNKIRMVNPGVFDNIIVFLVGDGVTYFTLKEYVEANKMKEHVIFTGYVSNYCDYINACDLFLLPSVGGEDMPLVILTAMALKKTILATKVAGITEEIEDEISGRLLDLSQLDTLYLEIVKLYHGLNLRQVYAGNAYNRFQNWFSQEIVYQKFINVYKKMVDRNNAYF